MLLPSATYRASDFLAAARALELEVVVGCEEALILPGGTMSLQVPLDDPEAAADAIVELDLLTPIDAVVAVDDQGTLVAARAAERLGLRHNRPDAVSAARDKLQMRSSLRRAEVPQPAFAAVPSGAGVDDLNRLIRLVGLPAVVKPTTLSGSQGVIRADTALDARPPSNASARSRRRPERRLGSRCCWRNSCPGPRSPWRACSPPEIWPCWPCSTSRTRSTGPSSRRPCT